MAKRAPDQDSSDDESSGTPDAPPEQARFAADFGRYAGLGIQLAATPLAFAALGWWLDKKLGTKPWMMLVGVFVGAAGGFYSIVRTSQKPTATSTQARDSSRKRP